MKRYKRHFGEKAKFVWKQEYQLRGALHFHLLMQGPTGENVRSFRDWLAAEWFDVVGSGDDRHRQAGTSVELAYTDAARYFTYAAGQKERQDDVPEGFTNPGRVWGVVGWRPWWIGFELDRREYAVFRRTARAWATSKGLRRGRTSRLEAGEWVLARPGTSATAVLRTLLRALSP